MSVLKLDALEGVLKQYEGKTLGDTNVPTLLIDAPRTLGATVGGNPVAAVFGASVDLSIELLNDARDEDKDGVIDMGKGGDSAALTFDSKAAWLKYGVTATCTAAATATIGTAAGGISGDRSLKLLCYRRHKPGAPILGTIGSDTSGFVTALTVDDISELDAGDIVSIATGGGIKASVTVKWGDILSVSGGMIGRLAKVLGSTDTMIAVDVGASVSFDVSVADAFQLSVACLAPDSYRVVLTTTDRVELNAGATFGVTASLSEDNAKALTDHLKSGWLGLTGDALTAINDATSITQLPKNIQPLVATLIARLHLPEGSLNDLKARLKAFDDECLKVIKSVAEAKVTLAFTCEYRRLLANMSVVAVNLNMEALERHHAKLLAFDVRDLLADAAIGPKTTIFDSTLQVTHAWNFTLGFGSWLSIGSAETVDAEKHQRIVVTSAGTRRTCSFAGNIDNVDNIWVNHEVRYGLLLKADTDFAIAPGGGSAARSDGALGLWWSDSKLSVAEKDDRARLVDDSVVFGLIGPDGAAELNERLAEISDGTTGARFDLVFSGDAMRRAISVFASATHDDWARHTARALPWNDSEKRGSPEAREETFGGFLQKYGNGPNIDVGKIPGAIHAYFGNAHNLGEWMWNILCRSDDNGTRFWPRWDVLGLGSRHFADLLQGTATDWDTFAITFHDRFATAKQTLLVRAMAGLLAERLSASLHDDPAYSVSLTIGGADQPGTRIVFG